MEVSSGTSLWQRWAMICAWHFSKLIGRWGPKSEHGATSSFCLGRETLGEVASAKLRQTIMILFIGRNRLLASFLKWVEENIVHAARACAECPDVRLDFLTKSQQTLHIWGWSALSTRRKDVVQLCPSLSSFLLTSGFMNDLCVRWLCTRRVVPSSQKWLQDSETCVTWVMSSRQGKRWKKRKGTMGEKTMAKDVFCWPGGSICSKPPTGGCTNPSGSHALAASSAPISSTKPRLPAGATENSSASTSSTSSTSAGTSTGTSTGTTGTAGTAALHASAADAADADADTSWTSTSTSSSTTHASSKNRSATSASTTSGGSSSIGPSTRRWIQTSDSHWTRACSTSLLAYARAGKRCGLCCSDSKREKQVNDLC